MLLHLATFLMVVFMQLNFSTSIGEYPMHILHGRSYCTRRDLLMFVTTLFRPFGRWCLGSAYITLPTSFANTFCFCILSIDTCITWSKIRRHRSLHQFISSTSAIPHNWSFDYVLLGQHDHAFSHPISQ